MSIIINAKGTSVPYFTVGKNGTTIYQGTADPSLTYTLKSGDVWFNGLTGAIEMWPVSGSTWAAPQIGNINFTGNTISAEASADLTLKVSSGNAFILDAGPGSATLSTLTGKDLYLSDAIGGGLYFNSLKWPSADGSANQVLTTNGSGTLSWVTNGSGTVTSASVVTANGFAGSVATSSTTPAITLTTTVTGIVKGNGTTLSAATSGTDYSVGTSALSTGILKSTTSTGSLSIAVAADFPTLNQNTSGNAATATSLATPRAINGVDFDGTAAITVTSAAGTLTGTTLNSAVVSSSLTSVGTVTSGTWSGSFGAVSGANLTSITGANVTGTVANATTAATATTANALNAANAYTGTSFNSITGLSSTTPAALGTAAVGTSTTAARADHIHQAPTTITGNASTATALQTARNINGVSFDGTGNITVTAAADTLTGTTLNSTVTTSGLTSVGTLSNLTVSGITTVSSIKGSVTTKTSNYAITSSDFMVLVNGTCTITLPSAATAGSGANFRIKNIGSGTVTISSVSGTIDSNSSLQLTVQYDSITTISDGANWWLI